MNYGMTPSRRRSWLIRPEESGDPFSAFRQQMNEMFENFYRHFELGTYEGWAPPVNVLEEEGRVCVTAELPGMEENEIEVSVKEGVLTIKGEKKEPKGYKPENYFRAERQYGRFVREIELPCEVETEKIDASCKNGVLTVMLPKSKEAEKEVKKIAVHTA